MRRTIPLVFLTLACQREAVEVTCVYEDQTEETGELVETGDTGAAVEESALVTWDASGVFTCDHLRERGGVIIEADLMASIEALTILWYWDGEPFPVDEDDLEVMEDGSIRWGGSCSDDDLFFFSFNVR